MVDHMSPKVKQRKCPTPRVIPSVQVSASAQKTRLVNLGLICLSRGWWSLVAAITRLVKGRWSHE
jgi:hypothetical protein